MSTRSPVSLKLLSLEVDLFFESLNHNGIIVPGAQVDQRESGWDSRFIDQGRDVVLAMDCVGTDRRGKVEHLLNPILEEFLPEAERIGLNDKAITTKDKMMLNRNVLEILM